jgi:hypothetical protein
MSAVRRLALVLIFALATAALGAASALAQVGTPNPGGGTCLRPTIEEGSGPVGLSRFLSSGFTIDLGLRSWINSYAVSRLVAPRASRPAADHTLTAAMPRRSWSR